MMFFAYFLSICTRSYYNGYCLSMCLNSEQKEQLIDCLSFSVLCEIVQLLYWFSCLQQFTQDVLGTSGSCFPGPLLTEACNK